MGGSPTLVFIIEKIELSQKFLLVVLFIPLGLDRFNIKNYSENGCRCAGK